MNALGVHFIDTILSDEKTWHVEEKEETAMTEETTSVGHIMNTLSCVYTTKNKIVEK